MTDNILLINPPLSDESRTSFFIMPVGLLSIAAFLKENNINSELIDLNILKRKHNSYSEFIKNSVDEIKNYIKNLNPVLIGFSIMVAGQFKISRNILKEIKRLYPNIKTVVGGANVTQFPKEILENCPEIDFVIMGEGENQSLACYKYIKNNGIPNELPDGIAYRINNKIVVQPKKTFISNIDNLPIPSYNLINFDNYIHDTTTWHNPFKYKFGVRVPIITSRGCPNLCNFCSVAGCMGSSHRAISAEKVVDMIQVLIEKYNSYYFAIFDANFTQDVNRVINICNEIKKRNLKLCLDLPTGLAINKTSRQMIDALVEIGLIRTGISIESGDVLIRNKVMRKKVEEEDIFVLIEDIRRYPHIHLLADFVLGMPEDTKESIELSCELIEKVDIDSIALSVATPYPGTPLYSQCVRDNLFFNNINYSNFWEADWYTHANIDKFIIKPYNLDLETLIEYKNRIIQLRDEKVKNYKKRMKNLFNIDSNFEPEMRNITFE